MKTKILYLLLFILGSTSFVVAQDQGQNEETDYGRFSGALNLNANVFLRDSLIGAFNIPQYDNELFGAEAWLDLNYSQYGFDLGLRFDMFNNSNLRNPNASFSAEGIGAWFVRKKIGKLGFTVGSIYDQIGTGIIFRSFEQRPLLIDNALIGAMVTYDFSENWQIKGFSGRQKNIFEVRTGILKGVNLEGFYKPKEGKVSFAPGIGFVNRTLGEETVEKLRGIFKGYGEDQRSKIQYNNYMGSVYNTLNAGKFVWYVEAALKSSDIFFSPIDTLVAFDGTSVLGKYVKKPGNVIYTSLSYATKGFGITLEAKRTENFNIRTDPTLTQIQGLVNFLPPMTRQNAYRLTTRYAPATNDLSEQALQADITYAFNRKTALNVNISHITDLDGNPLYKEFYSEFSYKYKRDWLVKTGVQLQQYNQEVYEVKPEAPLVETVVPYIDFLYKFNRKRSLRTELQYMFTGDDVKAGTKQDYGDWFYAQLEYSMVPNWTFTISDMYNISPGKNSPTGENGEKLALHYPRLDVFYTHHSNRFSLSYVKQVEGIVCTGGICRLEPAFSGFRFGLSSTF